MSIQSFGRTGRKAVKGCTALMLWNDQLVKMFSNGGERSVFLKNVVPRVTLDVFGILSRRNNELELSVRRLAGKEARNGHGV